jgi:gamma-glutamyl:cysteine ligase YbdK (ATP-grasp superfamily)
MAALPHLSVSELERILNRRRAKLAQLSREKDRLERQLAVIDNKIRAVGGGRQSGFTVTAGGRARNPTSLLKTLVQVMENSAKPMSVEDILRGVLDTGYRSTSPNFRSIVNMTLIKERKKFTNVKRGVYDLSK